MTSRHLAAALLAAGLLAFAVAPLTAQEFRGSILGTVTDTSGGALPGAKVTVTNEATGTTVEAQTNADGNYVVPFLLPATYTVAVAAEGFKAATQKGVVVQVQDKINLRFKLEVGAQAETIEVVARTPLLQQSNADLGQVVSRVFLDRLPTVGLSPLSLADMAPGVVAASASYISTDSYRTAINGGSGASGGNGGNDITVDGIPNLTARRYGLSVTMPMSDAVEEFKVTTTMFDASLGRSNAGAMSVTTRSGSNRLTGSAYYYARDAGLNANSWTNNRAGLPRPSGAKYHVAGATLGGPIKKDRTFFFVAAEQLSNESPFTRQGRVPTEAERNGDFSQTLDRNGKPLALYYPSSTGAARTPIPGGVIPAGLVDPTGRAVLALYPTPNQPTRAGEAGFRLADINWIDSTTFSATTYNFQVRIDHQLSQKQRLYARFSNLRHDQEPTPNFFDGAYMFGTSRDISNMETDSRRHYSFALNDTIIFGPSSVGTVSLGYTRYFQSIQGPGDGQDPGLLNVAPSLIGVQLTQAWPTFDLTQENIPSIGARVRQQANDVWTVMGTFSKLAGNHGLKFGFDYRMLNWNERNPDINYGAAGRFLFDYQMTAADPTKSTTGGSAMASLLLGYPTTNAGSTGSRVRQGTDLSLRNHYLALFVQDDWRIGQKLTVNLGLRYELETPYTERFDRQAYGFDPNASLGITIDVPVFDANGKQIGTQPTALAGGLTFVNEGGKPRRQGTIDWNNFGPRIGLAYTLNEKTVLRGGYGIFYASAAQNTGNSPTALESFGTVTPYVGSSDSNRTIIPGVNLQNPFPQGFAPITGSSLGVNTSLGDSITVPNDHYVLPYMQQWQMSVQRELPWEILFEAAYVGTHAVKVFESLNLNEVPDSVASVKASADLKVPNPFLAYPDLFPATSTLGNPGSKTINASQLTKPYPQFVNVTMQNMNTGRVGYNGLQLRLQKRLSKGLAFVAAYAFSKTMVYEQRSIVNERVHKTVSQSDTPQIFRLAATLDLPFGRGRTWGKDIPTALDWVLGGWALSWQTKYTSGAALVATQSKMGNPIPIADPTTSGGIHDRLGDQTDASGTITNPWFDKNAFQPLVDTYAISPTATRYGWIRGPYSFFHNAALFKTLALTDRFKLELRIEADNVFNSPQFAGPNDPLSGNPVMDISDPNFGKITTSTGSRTVRFGAKMRF
jgi:Carboxypeptidase regulatory-like domain/TonB dependent receptor-like, beta-barrel